MNSEHSGDEAGSSGIGTAPLPRIEVAAADRDAALLLRAEIVRQLGPRPNLSVIENSDFDVQLLARHRIGEWQPHLDYAGEPMQAGEFRDPPEDVADAVHERLWETERFLRAVLAAQMVDPYRGWHMTALNKVADEARAFLGMPSVRALNPDIAKMQDHIATNPDALAILLGRGASTKGDNGCE